MANDLEWILTMQAGIGMTFPEAEAAMVESKKQKPVLNYEVDPVEVTIDKMMKSAYDAKFPIVQFGSGISVDNNKIFTKDLIEDVETDLAVYHAYDNNSEVQKDIFKIMSKRMYDRKTGVFTLYGHLMEKKLRKDDEQGVVIYFDCGFMHELNRMFSEYEVDRRLTLIGQAFSKCVRRTRVDENSSDNSGRREDRISRVNLHSAEGYLSRRRIEDGDEFLAEIFAPIEKTPEIVARLFKGIYSAQYRGLYGKTLYT